MKFTKYYWLSDEIDNKKTRILLHTLYGTIHLLSSEEYTQVMSLLSGDENINEEFLNELIKYEFWIKEKTDQQKFEDIVKRTLENQKQNYKIQEIVFIISYACNFDCPYCYEKDFKIDSKKRINVKQVDMALKIFENSIQYISFFGGEPFLPSNKEIIQYIISKTKGKKYTAMTNGYYLEEYLDIIPNEQIKFIQVTLDGDKEIHNKTRIMHSSGETFNKIMRGIGTAINRGIHIKIRMNINETNIMSCINLRKKMLDQYGGNFLSFELYPIFQNSNNINSYLMDNLINYDFELTPYHRLNVINEITDTGLPIERSLLNGRDFSQIVSHCEAHTNKRFIDPDGDIYSCILSVGLKNARIGTYYPQYKLSSRSILYRNILKINECKKCKFALICGGGCPLVYIKEGADLMQPNCSAIYDLISSRLIRDCKIIMKRRKYDVVL